MFVVQVVVAVGIVLATVLVAAGRGDGLSPTEARSRRPAVPADRPLEAADLADVRLGVGLRGYRMDEVDDLLDRVTIELAGRDERIAELERLRQIAAVRAWTPPAGEPHDGSRMSLTKPGPAGEAPLEQTPTAAAGTAAEGSTAGDGTGVGDGTVARDGMTTGDDRTAAGSTPVDERTAGDG